MRRAIPLVSSTRGALMLVPAYLWAVLGAIMLATCVLVGAWSEPAKAAPPPAQYSITDLGTLPGGESSFANAINDRGQVVGLSQLITFVEPDYHFFDYAFLWENGKMTNLDLGTLPGGRRTEGVAEDINNRGQVVGSATNDRFFENRAFLWESGKMTELGTLPGGSFSEARGINNRGQIVGWSDTVSGEHAVLWTK